MLPGNFGQSSLVVAWGLSGGRMMKPRFPELRVGPAIRRNHMTIYPLFQGQRLLFSDAERGPEFRAAAYRERAKLKNFGGRQATREIPMISNTSSTRALFLPFDSVGKHEHPHHCNLGAPLVPVCGCRRYAAARLVAAVAIEFDLRLVRSVGSLLGAINGKCTYSATRRPQGRPDCVNGPFVPTTAQFPPGAK